MAIVTTVSLAATSFSVTPVEVSLDPRAEGHGVGRRQEHQVSLLAHGAEDTDF